jgi:tRNA dimethylallyltransferase
MSEQIPILCIIGPTASGKSGRAVEEALKRNGEVISVDSRQVYRGLDIGTEKITHEEMQGVPHHLIDIREPDENYSAGEFAQDAAKLIGEIHAHGKLPILAGGSHFYFDALLRGMPDIVPINAELRAELEKLPADELFARVQKTDPRRAAELDPRNPRRIIRALEIIAANGVVSPRTGGLRNPHIEWIVMDIESQELRKRINTRLKQAFERGLIDEVQRVRESVGDTRLNELGLEYRVVGEYVRSERNEASLLPTLSAKLWQYARRQRAWMRKLLAIQ